MTPCLIPNAVCLTRKRVLNNQRKYPLLLYLNTEWLLAEIKQTQMYKHNIQLYFIFYLQYCCYCFMALDTNNMTWYKRFNVCWNTWLASWVPLSFDNTIQCCGIADNFICFYVVLGDFWGFFKDDTLRT